MSQPTEEITMPAKYRKKPVVIDAAQPADS